MPRNRRGAKNALRPPNFRRIRTRWLHRHRRGEHAMRRKLLAAASLLAFSMALPASAGEQSVGLNDQTGVAVTIYNQDFALVRDARRITLAKGDNDVAFLDVSGPIQPQTPPPKS